MARKSIGFLSLQGVKDMVTITQDTREQKSQDETKRIQNTIQKLHLDKNPVFRDLEIELKALDIGDYGYDDFARRVELKIGKDGESSLNSKHFENQCKRLMLYKMNHSENPQCEVHAVLCEESDLDIYKRFVSVATHYHIIPHHCHSLPAAIIKIVRLCTETIKPIDLDTEGIQYVKKLEPTTEHSQISNQLINTLTYSIPKMTIDLAKKLLKPEWKTLADLCINYHEPTANKIISGYYKGKQMQKLLDNLSTYIGDIEKWI